MTLKTPPRCIVGLDEQAQPIYVSARIADYFTISSTDFGKSVMLHASTLTPFTEKNTNDNPLDHCAKKVCRRN